MANAWFLRGFHFTKVKEATFLPANESAYENLAISLHVTGKEEWNRILTKSRETKNHDIVENF